jgi:hypothetical protein
MKLNTKGRHITFLFQKLLKDSIMKNLNIVLTILILVSLFAPAFAQGPPPQTPIDGGLSFLLLAGGAYGLKKIRDRKK